MPRPKNGASKHGARRSVTIAGLPHCGGGAAPVGLVLVHLAKVGLTVTLFLIGAGLSATVVKSVGVRPYVLGVLLWVVISTASLYVILQVRW